MRRQRRPRSRPAVEPSCVSSRGSPGSYLLRRIERVLRRGTCRASKPAQNDSRFFLGRGLRRAWRKDGRPDPPTGGQITVRTAVLTGRRRRGWPLQREPATCGSHVLRYPGGARPARRAGRGNVVGLRRGAPPRYWPRCWRCRRRRAGERQQTKRVPAARQPHGPDLLAECRQEGGPVRRRRARCAAPTPRSGPDVAVSGGGASGGGPRLPPRWRLPPGHETRFHRRRSRHRSAGVTPHLLPVCGRRIRPQSRTRMRAPGRLTADDHGGELHRAAHPPRPVRGSPTRRLGASAARPGRGSALR